MYATYYFKPDAIPDSFIQTLKETNRNTEIAVTIEDVEDETEYLLKSNATRKMLLEGVVAVKNKNYVHTMTMEQVEALAK